jgi:NTE family protein
MSNVKIGIVLSGGGARGAAHIGILKALAEHNITPAVVSGSSAGAIVGALYAAGYSFEKVLEFYTLNSGVFQWKKFARKKIGLLDTAKYVDIFQPWLKEKRFEDLDKELFLCAVDIFSGLPHYFNSGDLIDPILASAAVPGVFSPVEIAERWYIDGSTMNNFPIRPLIGQCDFIIGSFVSTQRQVSRTDLKSTLQLINRSADLAILAASMEKFSLADYMFIPDQLWQYGTFDSKKVPEIYQIGYDFAKSKIEDFLKVFHSKQS